MTDIVFRWLRRTSRNGEDSGVPDAAYARKISEKVFPARREAFLMMLVTGAYLIFEVAFGARLLDVVGSTTDLHEIEQIENAGRVISGIALTLVVWTSSILPRIRRMPSRTNWRRLKAASMLGLSTVACCLASFTIQEAILDGLSYGSSSAQRQAASTLTLVSASVQTSSASLKGMDLDVIDRSSPEMKAFMALLPSLALSVDKLEERTEDVIEELLEAQAVARIGSDRAFFVDIYYPSMNELKRAFNEIYIPAADKHAEAAARIPGEQQRLYRAYRNSLGGPGATPERIPRSRYGRVGSEVRSMGVPVPWGWDPRDRDTFMQAVDHRMRSEFEPEYDRIMIETFGATLPSNLDAGTFFSHPVVQESWRSAMGMEHDLHVPLDLEGEDATERLYKPWIDAIVAAERPLYFSPLSDFETGGEHHDAGVRAIRVAYVPLIAFAFSLLGALVHSFKTMNFAIQCGIGHETRRAHLKCSQGKLILLLSIGALAAVISRVENEVTRSELYLELEQQTSMVMGKPIAIAMRIVVQLQPFAYPIAESLRTDVLQGLTFDFDPQTAIPVFEAAASGVDS